MAVRSSRQTRFGRFTLTLLPCSSVGETASRSSSVAAVDLRTLDGSLQDSGLMTESDVLQCKALAVLYQEAQQKGNVA